MKETWFTRVRPLLQSPVFEDDAKKTLAAALLNGLLWFLLIVLVIYVLLIPVLVPDTWWVFPIVLVVILINLSALLVMRSGRIWAASLLFSSMIWLFITIISIFLDGVNGVPFVAYIVVVIICGLLLGGRGAAVSAGLSIVAGLGMYLADINGVLPASLALNDSLTKFGTISLLTVVAALLIHLSTSGLYNMLNIVQEKNLELEQEVEKNLQLQQEIIETQRLAIQELSAPVIPVMDRVIVMPLIGSIDSMRARDITRNLLAGISKHGAEVLILDITGVPVVDSGVAQHFSKAIYAARLKGARTIVTGISDAVAETIVDLGIDWSEIETLCDLQTGLLAALDSSRIKSRR